MYDCTFACRLHLIVMVLMIRGVLVRAVVTYMYIPPCRGAKTSRFTTEWSSKEPRALELLEHIPHVIPHRKVTLACWYVHVHGHGHTHSAIQ